MDFFVAHLDRLKSSISVRELCERVSGEFARRLTAGEISEEHFTTMKETSKRFAQRFGDQPIKLLPGTEIKEWLALEPLAIKTRNRHLGYIRNIFSLGREWNLLDRDPFERVSGFHDPLAKSRRVSISTPEQLTAFLNAVPRDFVPFFALNAFSGLRRKEIIRLDWDEVKLKRNLILLPAHKSKNGKVKRIEVGENLKAWLTPFAQKEGRVKPKKKVQLALEKGYKAAGIIPLPQNVLRHSFCSHSVALKGFEWTSEQADHSIAILRRDYWEVVDKETARDYWKIFPEENLAPEPKHSLRTQHDFSTPDALVPVAV